MDVDRRACDSALTQDRAFDSSPTLSLAQDGVESSRFCLTYRPPYDWDAVLAFLGARATPGVEAVADGRYRRTISVDATRGHLINVRSVRLQADRHGPAKAGHYVREETSGLFQVSHLESQSALDLEVHVPDPRTLPFIVDRVRRLFDLGADPAVIGEQLGVDPLLGQALARHPGIRTPGAWDGFELAVRAILGQQVSVRAATTIAGRMASMFGSSVVEGRGLERLFPTAAQLADAAIERAGVMPARAATIRGLARRVTEGTIAFGSSTDGPATRSALRGLPGIGDWTAEYIAMRAFGERDAFPSGDLVLRRAAGGCTARELGRKSEAWRPWRAYAVMLLWQDATDLRNKS